METTETSTPTLVRHPVRGGVYGLLLGLGMAILLMLNGTIALLAIMPFVIVVLIGIAVGGAWAMFAPATKPKNA